MNEDDEPDSQRTLDEALNWLARERDAVWTAKLVIRRVEPVDDILHFGQCLREHETHVVEWAHWAESGGARLERATLLEPSFVTGEPHVIGALAESAAVLAAMETIEAARVAAYLSLDAMVSMREQGSFGRLLARHLVDARARLDWIRRRLRSGETVQEAAAQ
jgi:hypothetical protein